MENENVKYELYGLRKKDLDIYRYTCLSFPSRSFKFWLLNYASRQTGSFYAPLNPCKGALSRYSA